MSSSFDDFSQQNSDALQSTIDSTSTSLLDGQSFSHDTYTQSAFDHNSLTDTAYQSDHSSTESQWQDTAFQNTPEHSLNQEIDALFNGSDSSDDSNNQNASNLIMPTFQHPPHYHVPHEHFHAPEPLEKEHEIRHALSSPESTSEVHHVMRSDVHHYHHIVRPNSTTEGGDGNYNNYNSFDAPSSDSGGCVDADGDGACDSGSSSDSD